MTDILEARRAH